LGIEDDEGGTLLVGIDAGKILVGIERESEEVTRVIVITAADARMFASKLLQVANKVDPPS